jgi:hypothetical protein
VLSKHFNCKQYEQQLFWRLFVKRKKQKQKHWPLAVSMNPITAFITLYTHLDTQILPEKTFSACEIQFKTIFSLQLGETYCYQ